MERLRSVPSDFAQQQHNSQELQQEQVQVVAANEGPWPLEGPICAQGVPAPHVVQEQAQLGQQAQLHSEAEEPAEAVTPPAPADAIARRTRSSLSLSHTTIEELEASLPHEEVPDVPLDEECEMYMAFIASMRRGERSKSKPPQSGGLLLLPFVVVFFGGGGGGM
eukprot:jgi/Mesen1/10852/ME000093S10371